MVLPDGGEMDNVRSSGTINDTVTYTPNGMWFPNGAKMENMGFPGPIGLNGPQESALIETKLVI